MRMPKSNPFVEHLLELCEPMAGVTAKKMFGGYGLFRDGLMFALVDDDVLFLKVDEQTLPAFVERGLEPFVYVKEGKPMPMSYYQAPDEALDNADETVEWAEKAYAAAVRAQTAKQKKKRKKTEQ
jgi:DNA transformation protein